MMKPSDAERTSGYSVGGISPFGQRREVPTVIEEQTLAHAFVFLNGGQRGLQVRLDPKLALKALGARAAAVIT
jgi:Cys-tRNA(Pro)/Cys-tRNA(Cys) deacylase